jgi:hypothetical protein
MHIHRSQQLRQFTVLPNGLLQDRRLSFTARGLLVDLLSRPEGWREDGRQMADSSPQGRGAVQRALKELAAAGYYRVDRVRRADGTIRSEAHVFDTPQLGQQLGQPCIGRPGSGEARPGSADVPYVKDQGKNPTLPNQLRPGDPEATAAAPDEQTRAAVAVLYRVLRPEPRLKLGGAEALALAPLVAQWLERGVTEVELAIALLPGLPQPMHFPAAVIRNRLERKLPPPKGEAAGPAYAECAKCHDPVAGPGICRSCAGLGQPVVGAQERATLTARGMALVRAAMRSGGVGAATG